MNIPFDINTTNEIDIDKVSFNHFGVKYIGIGTLKWNKKEGFELKANFDPEDYFKFKGKKSYGGPKLLKNKLFSFSINEFWKAYTWIPFSEFNEIPLLFGNGKISANFYNLIFYSEAVYNKNESLVRGNCYFNLAKGTHLPDAVSKEIKIKDNIIFQSKKFEGILIEDNFFRIQGYLNDSKVFEISWEMDKELIPKNTQWEVAIAIKDSLSINLGQTVVLLRRDLYRNDKSIIELIKEKEVTDLGYFKPIYNKNFFDKEKFNLIFKALLKKDKNAKIIHELFYQIADSLIVRNFAMWQFMLANSLEAFLRTYYEKPFQIGKKNDTFKVESYLYEFKREYFEKDYVKEWRDIFKKVYQCYKDLRHINAHPDWLNSLNSETNQKKIEAMRYLSKFYGYVILALAGYRNLKPEF